MNLDVLKWVFTTQFNKDLLLFVDNATRFNEACQILSEERYIKQTAFKDCRAEYLSISGSRLKVMIFFDNLYFFRGLRADYVFHPRLSKEIVDTFICPVLLAPPLGLDRHFLYDIDTGKMTIFY